MLLMVIMTSCYSIIVFTCIIEREVISFYRQIHYYNNLGTCPNYLYRNLERFWWCSKFHCNLKYSGIPYKGHFTTRNTFLADTFIFYPPLYKFSITWPKAWLIISIFNNPIEHFTLLVIPMVVPMVSHIRERFHYFTFPFNIMWPRHD